MEEEEIEVLIVCAKAVNENRRRGKSIVELTHLVKQVCQFFMKFVILQIHNRFYHTLPLPCPYHICRRGKRCQRPCELFFLLGDADALSHSANAESQCPFGHDETSNIANL